MNNRYSRTLIVAATLLMCAFFSTNSARAQETLQLSPVDDTYGVIRPDHEDETKIWGIENEPVLWIRAATSLERRAYMKFDLTEVSGVVEKAVVFITADLVNADKPHMLYVSKLADDSWSETELTGENMPEVGETLLMVPFARQTSTDPDFTAELDITDYVKEELDAGDKVVSIVLHNPTALTAEFDGTDIRFHSAEVDPFVGEAPYLELTLAPGTATERDELPEGFAVEQNYPNPFNPETVIPFTVPTAGTVSVKVYDALGQEVAELMKGRVNAGKQTVSWNGINAKGATVATGVYFVRVEFAGQVKTIAMSLIR